MTLTYNNPNGETFEIATVDIGSEQSCEAEGHPSECTPIVSGNIAQQTAHGLTEDDTTGSVRQIATIDSANLHFDSHSHDYDDIDGCHDDQSHDIDPDSDKTLSSITINGSPLYLRKDAVTTDPISGGNVNIL